jgi:hypothetical protein
MSGTMTRRPKAAMRGAITSKSRELRVSPCRQITGSPVSGASGA